MSNLIKLYTFNFLYFNKAVMKKLKIVITEKKNFPPNLTAFNAAEYNFLVMYSKYYLESDAFFIITAWKLDFTAHVL